MIMTLLSASVPSLILLLFVLTTITHLHLDPRTHNLGPIQHPHRLLCILTILHLDEAKPGGSSGDPHIFDWAIFAKGILQVILICLLMKSSHIYLAIKVPALSGLVPTPRHQELG